MLTYQGFIFSLKEKLIMYRLFQSIGFVFSNLFSRKVYDVVFYYPQHFNRDENSENGILWNDKSLKIKWPIKKPIISKKDKDNKSFSFYFD